MYRSIHHPIALTSAIALACALAACSGTVKKPVEPNDEKPIETVAKPVVEAPTDGLKPHEPVECSGTQDVRLERVKIETEGVAVSVSGSCDVVIVDSEISAKSVAILISEGAEVDVDISNSTIKGGEAAYVIDGAGDISAKNTKFIGGRLDGNGTFRDDGGNTWE